MADLAHGDRVHPGEGFVKQQVFRFSRKAAGDFHAATLAAGQSHGRGAAQVGDGEFGQQFIQPGVAFGAVRDVNFQHGEDVVFDRQAPEDRHFLRQIADAHAGAAIHRLAGHVLPVQQHLPAFGLHQTRDGIKAGRLAGPVGAEQGHDLSAVQVQRDIADHRAALVAFAQGADVQARAVVRIAALRKASVGHHFLAGVKVVVTRPPAMVPRPVVRLMVSVSPAIVACSMVRITWPVITRPEVPTT